MRVSRSHALFPCLLAHPFLGLGMARGSIRAAINQPFFSGGMSKRLHVLEGSDHN